MGIGKVHLIKVILAQLNSCLVAMNNIEYYNQMISFNQRSIIDCNFANRSNQFNIVIETQVFINYTK